MRGAAIGGESAAGQDFAIHIQGVHHVGMLREVLDTLHAEGLDVVEALADVESGDVASEQHTDSDVFIVRSRGAQKDFDEEKLREISHHLEEVCTVGASISFEAALTPPKSKTGVKGMHAPSRASSAFHIDREVEPTPSMLSVEDKYRVGQATVRSNAQVLPLPAAAEGQAEPVQVIELGDDEDELGEKKIRW